MKLIFILVCVFLIKSHDCLELKCLHYQPYSMKANTYDAFTKKYNLCSIVGLQLINENEEITINGNPGTTLVYFSSGCIVTFLPSSMFIELPNIEYVVIPLGKFEIMKAEYLKNAKKLKNFHVYKNLVKKLDANVFLHASNLEHINFEENLIESVHKLAFNGLPHLQGVYLHKNKITMLHPSTFSSISNLNILELSGNACIDQEFLNANKKLVAIETAIQASCTFEVFPEVLTSLKLVEDGKQKLANLTESLRMTQENLNKANDLNKNLIEDIQGTKEKLEKVEEKLKIQDEELKNVVSNFTISTQLLLDEILKVNGENCTKFHEEKFEQKLKEVVDKNEKFQQLLESQTSVIKEYFENFSKTQKNENEVKSFHKNENEEALETCKIEIQKSELKTSNNYWTLVQLVIDQKEIAKKSVSDLQDNFNVIQKVSDLHDQRLKKLENQVLRPLVDGKE